jgi:hypothetical protein
MSSPQLAEQDYASLSGSVWLCLAYAISGRCS